MNVSPSRSVPHETPVSADTPAPTPEATTEATAPAKGKMDAAATQPAAGEKVAKAHKATKSTTKKQKLIRDSFSFPETDYALIDKLKKRALEAGREAKKSEVLRAALTTLAGLPTAALLQALDDIEKLAPGRPAH